MTRKRLPQSDYDARYDVVRALLTVTARDTRKGVRVAHRLNPQPKGTVDGRREQAKRVPRAQEDPARTCYPWQWTGGEGTR